MLLATDTKVTDTSVIALLYTCFLVLTFSLRVTRIDKITRIPFITFDYGGWKSLIKFTKFMKFLVYFISQFRCIGNRHVMELYYILVETKVIVYKMQER